MLKFFSIRFSLTFSSHRRADAGLNHVVRVLNHMQNKERERGVHTAPAVPSSLIVGVTAPLQPPAQVNPQNRTAVSHMAAEPAAANWNIAPGAETLAQLLEAAGTTAAAATAAHQESGGSP